jgi:hypothetical protein
MSLMAGSTGRRLGHVAAPADVMQSPIIRAIFKARELVLGSQPDTAEHPRGVVAFTKSNG